MRDPLWVLTMFFSLIVAGLVLSSNENLWAQKKAQTTPEALGPQAIFKLPSREIELKVVEKIQACRDANQRRGAGDPEFVACVVSVMKEAGASPQAIAFTTLLQGEGYMDSFREMGKVDLATVVYPFRANDNGELLLVNGVPGLLHVDDPSNLRQIDIRKDPLYPSLVSKYPKLELWGHPEFKTMQQRPGGGQRFVFSLVLLNGCHACEIGGYAHVAFDFDSAGNYLGTKLLRLSKKV